MLSIRRRNAAAAALVIVLSFTSTVLAQSALQCPLLPADSGLTWTTLDGAKFVFCKAIRATDGKEQFAVTVSEKSPFKPSRGNRREETVIDGHEVYWYTSKIASDPDAQVRETLIEINDDQVAHINFRADNGAQLAERLQQVQTIRFQGTQLTSK